jgi:threonine synthase
VAFRDRLPVNERTPNPTLLEGNTPLVPSVSIGPALGVDLFFKWEGANPTGSFKDRGMVVAVARALEAGARGVICASTGNTAASAAAYAARAGLRCVVLLPEGAVAAGKLAQARMHGARVALVPGGFDGALDLVRRSAQSLGLAVVNSINPDRLEGQKTAAFEILDALQRAPDIVALPVGNAGNITAYWRGFCEVLPEGRPALWGFQAEGAAPLVRGHPIAEPKTIATAIRIGNPASWQGALGAVRESGGRIAAVSDDEILSSQRRLAVEEGLFVEPASAAAVAGLLRAAAEGFLPRGALVVAVLTGHGLKDPDVAERAPQPVRIEPTVDAVASLLR